MLVSGVQQSDSVIRIHTSSLFKILFTFMLLQNIEQNFMGCINNKFSLVQQLEMYFTFKVRRGGCEEISLAQGKE